MSAMFAAPPAPAWSPDQSETTEGYLRYEDVTQDGRLIALAIPPALAGLWRGRLTRHVGAKNAAATGILPILTRLTLASHDRAIRVDRVVEARSGFELAHGDDGRLFMNVWSEVHGAAGRIVPREPAGPLVLAGQLFAEHTFTRPFGPPDQRRVTRLDVEGYPSIPEARHDAQPVTTAGDAPAGATWTTELAADSAEIALTLDQTDSNQHVNSLVYLRIFLDAAQRRLPELAVRATALDIGYRKPCFAGERVRTHLRLFDLPSAPLRGAARPGQAGAIDLPGSVGAAGFIAAGDGKPRCYVRAIFGR